MKQFKKKRVMVKIKKKVPDHRQESNTESHPGGIEKPETAPAAVVFTSVECPHYAGCRFGKAQSRQARIRCYGKLYKVSQSDSCLMICIKCKLEGKKILMEINGSECRHIRADSPEYEALYPLLKPIRCHNCESRVLDLYRVHGEATLDLKCSNDRHQGLYPV